MGLAQYLARFLPNLSELTKPLRDLTQRDVHWVWGDTKKAAFQKLKEAVTPTPMLRYFNLDEEVTMQCDASKSGLGAALMQNRQPVAVAYALTAMTTAMTTALTPAETRYAHIEKELLAIVFAYDRFNFHIAAGIGSSLQVKYRKGKNMLLADIIISSSFILFKLGSILHVIHIKLT